MRMLVDPLLSLHLSTVKPRAIMLRIVKSDMLSFESDQLDRIWDFR